MEEVKKFVSVVLRGIGQVFFQNNPWTGFLFLIGIAVNSWEMALYALLGTAISTLAAYFLRVPSGLIDVGLLGFNGTLTGIGLAVFLDKGPMLFLYIIVGSILSTIIMTALLNFCGQWDVPPLTAPFVITTWIMLLSAYAFFYVHPSSALEPAVLPIAKIRDFSFFRKRPVGRRIKGYCTS